MYKIKTSANFYVNGGETDHDKLNNLDYEHSGHTGFQPAGNYIEDSNYVHTDNNYTTEEKTKLSNLENYDDTEIKRDIQSLEDTKVDREVNKGLSTNDYTNEEKSKLASLENYDDTQVKTDITSLSTNKADKSEIPDVSDFITKDVDDLSYYTLAVDTGHSIELTLNSSTYVLTLSLKNSEGTVLNTNTVDLPLETMVVDGDYDSTNKKIVLTLQSGSTIDIPVGDLVSGLQTEITSNNKLSADLVDDTNSTNKLTNATEKSTWNAKYDKPSGGIPSTDMSSAVQTSLGKADTAIQDISGKQDVLVSGTNIKTINGQSILGSGNIDTEVIQYSTLPTASLDNLGKIVQYIGTTDSTYTNGYFYQCVSDGESTPTYSWNNINVQSGGGSVSEGLPTYLVGSPSETSSVDIPLETLKAGIYKPQYEKMGLYLTKNGQQSFKIYLVNDLIIFKDYADAEVGEIFGLVPQWDDGSSPRMFYRYIKKTNDSYGYGNDYSKIGNMPNFSNYLFANTYGPVGFNGAVTFGYCPSSYYGPTNDTDLANKKYVDDAVENAIDDDFGKVYLFRGDAFNTSDTQLVKIYKQIKADFDNGISSTFIYFSNSNLYDETTKSLFYGIYRVENFRSWNNKLVLNSIVWQLDYTENWNNQNYSILHLCSPEILITFDGNGDITSISSENNRLKSISFLKTSGYGNSAFIPTTPGAPASKKYVDDSITAAIGTALGGSY